MNREQNKAIADLGGIGRERYHAQVPLEKAEREAIRNAADTYVAAHRLVPPLSVEELHDHATAVMREHGFPDECRNFVLVMISNAVWRDTMAAIPFERRILLLPQCLRSKASCRARLDALGLLCEQCGKCCTGELQAEAEERGYVVLIAEGTTVVTKLLESGKVDAVIGVSCLSVLERAFPHMAADAIPGLAFPLIRTGCDRTEVDIEWIMEAIKLRSDDKRNGRIDVEAFRREVESWFDSPSLVSELGFGGTTTEKIGISWLGTAGKRWRPLLALCACKALGGGESDSDGVIRKIGMAVECFHKASLVHDDIEDDGDFRYGDMTLHRRHGVPVALNAGDFLIGEGYRMIAESGATASQIVRLLAIAADGHRSLSLGQGDELLWMRNPVPLSSKRVIEIFERKTAPAFEVALTMGAICAGADDEVCAVLKRFSRALGIAYQIQDDLDDFSETEAANDLRAMRMSLLPALAREHAPEELRNKLDPAWKRGMRGDEETEIRNVMIGLRVEEKARQLIEHHKHEALRSLNPLRHADLKVLLRRLVGKIVRNVQAGEHKKA